MVAWLLCASLSGCLGEDLLLTEDCSEFEATLREDDGVLRVLTYDIASSEEFLQDFTNDTGIEVEPFVPTTLEASSNRCCCTRCTAWTWPWVGRQLPSLRRQPLPHPPHGVDLTGLDGACSKKEPA